MEKYDNYKDSGIEWIGEIPEHWDSVSLKWISFIYSGGTPSRNKPEYWNDGTIPWLNSGEVNQGDIKEASEYITEEALSDSSAKWIPEKSLVMALAGQGKTKGMIAQVQFRTTCNQSLGVIVPNDKIDNRFLMYWLRKNYQNIRNLGGGDKRDGINLEMIGSIKTPITTLNEQSAIANYLDRKTAEIDGLIADKKRLLELYEEEKTAIINQAVTKGIKPDVTMKDSGIEWLGEIPEHWEVKRFKYFFNLITEKVEEDLPKIGLENIESKSGKLIETDSDFAGQGVRFKPNDILFGKLRPYLAKVWIANFDGQAVGDFYVFRSKKDINPEFAKYRILDSSFIEVTNSSTYGSKMPRVSWEFIADLPISFPKNQEQKSIVQYIEKEITRINAKVEKTIKLIDLLTEYRTALISEVVTGKIKVIE